jgi:ParB family transcriptional regulator, chromosome partitioning protein
MATTARKTTSLGTTRDIPFDKLVPSRSNVRRTRAGVSLDELAEDIARRGLLQNLNVRPVLDGEGRETGTFEVHAGGRRLRALEILVKAKRLPKAAPVPCNVREAGSPIAAEEDSLAENTRREALHPLDQFRAFKALVDRGEPEEEVAARFFVPAAVVRQRLRLASVAPALLDVYAGDGMTLDQLTAFTVTGDHARQVQAWETLQRSYNREPHHIRRLLTEGAVAASDRRARFVGVEAYEAAGGAVSRDLFSGDDGGGWLEDAGLLERLATEHLAREAGTVGAEGWRWVEVAPDFAYGHAAGLRRLHGRAVPLTDEERATEATLSEELDRIHLEHEGWDDLPEAAAARSDQIEAALDGLRSRPVVYDPAEVARGGAFVSIGPDGRPRVERGFVRPEDEPAVAPGPDGGEGPASAAGPAGPPRAVPPVDGAPAAGGEDAADEDDGALRPLSDRLVAELTAHRTLALRDALGRDADAAHLAVLHFLCLSAFYHHGSTSCLELTARSAGFPAQAPGLADAPSARAIERRHDFWAGRLPDRPDGLWPTLAGFGPPERQALFAHCASLTVNVTREPFDRRPRAIVHGEVLARAVGLDMAAAGWRPTVDNYLGRVPKARILEAVREARGEMAAQLIDHLRKPDMAREAERLLADSGWVPEPLVVAGAEIDPATDAGGEEALPAFLAGERDEPGEGDPDPGPRAIAAE